MDKKQIDEGFIEYAKRDGFYNESMAAEEYDSEFVESFAAGVAWAEAQSSRPAGFPVQAEPVDHSKCFRSVSLKSNAKWWYEDCEGNQFFCARCTHKNNAANVR